MVEGASQPLHYKSSPSKITATNPLKILTLNLGFHVMGNEVAGSEAPQVVLCHAKYPADKLETQSKNKGHLPQCTMNAISLLTDYDLIGLQEINRANPERLDRFKQRVGELEIAKGRRYVMVNNGKGAWGIGIMVDINRLGMPIVITPKDFEIYDPTKTIPPDRRGFQLIYCPLVKLLIANGHLPHKLDIKLALEDAFKRAKPYLAKAGVEEGMIEKVAIMGDFNDPREQVLSPNFELNVYGKRVKIPVNPNMVPRTCCTDTQHQLKGDYILLSSPVTIYQYGLPENYQRLDIPISDHDPLSAQITFDD